MVAKDAPASWKVVTPLDRASSAARRARRRVCGSPPGNCVISSSRPAFAARGSGWSPKGDEIFYRRGSEMMVVPVRTTGGLTPGAPAVLFEGRYDIDPFGQDATNYDVTRDGKRFVMVRRAADSRRSRQELRIVLNWFEDLKRLTPAK